MTSHHFFVCIGVKSALEAHIGSRLRLLTSESYSSEAIGRGQRPYAAPRAVNHPSGLSAPFDSHPESFFNSVGARPVDGRKARPPPLLGAQGREGGREGADKRTEPLRLGEVCFV